MFLISFHKIIRNFIDVKRKKPKKKWILKLEI